MSLKAGRASIAKTEKTEDTSSSTAVVVSPVSVELDPSPPKRRSTWFVYSPHKWFCSLVPCVHENVGCVARIHTQYARSKRRLRAYCV